jgi:hypothetical protein
MNSPKLVQLITEIKFLGTIIDKHVIMTSCTNLKKETGDGLVGLLDLDDDFIRSGKDPLTFFFYEQIVRGKLENLVTKNQSLQYNSYTYFEICSNILGKFKELNNTEDKINVLEIGQVLYQVREREILE